MTRPQNPPGHRSTCFIVPMDDPNLSYHEMVGKEVWLQSSTGAIALDGVEVPDSAMLGEADEGFRVMVTTLNGGRLFIASLAWPRWPSRWTPAAPTPRNAGSSAISPSGGSSACRTCCSTWTSPWSRGSPG